MAILLYIVTNEDKKYNQSRGFPSFIAILFSLGVYFVFPKFFSSVSFDNPLALTVLLFLAAGFIGLLSKNDTLYIFMVSLTLFVFFTSPFLSAFTESASQNVDEKISEYKKKIDTEGRTNEVYDDTEKKKSPFETFKETLVKTFSGENLFNPDKEDEEKDKFLSFVKIDSVNVFPSSVDAGDEVNIDIESKSREDLTSNILTYIVGVSLDERNQALGGVCLSQGSDGDITYQQNCFEMQSNIISGGNKVRNTFTYVAPFCEKESLGFSVFDVYFGSAVVSTKNLQIIDEELYKQEAANLKPQEVVSTDSGHPVKIEIKADKYSPIKEKTKFKLSVIVSNKEDGYAYTTVNDVFVLLPKEFKIENENLCQLEQITDENLLKKKFPKNYEIYKDKYNFYGMKARQGRNPNKCIAPNNDGYSFNCPVSFNGDVDSQMTYTILAKVNYAYTLYQDYNGKIKINDNGYLGAKDCSDYPLEGDDVFKGLFDKGNRSMDDDAEVTYPSKELYDIFFSDGFCNKKSSIINTDTSYIFSADCKVDKDPSKLSEKLAEAADFCYLTQIGSFSREKKCVKLELDFPDADCSDINTDDLDEGSSLSVTDILFDNNGNSLFEDIFGLGRSSETSYVIFNVPDNVNTKNDYSAEIKFRTECISSWVTVDLKENGANNGC